jgi:hypothetical protein
MPWGVHLHRHRVTGAGRRGPSGTSAQSERYTCSGSELRPWFIPTIAAVAWASAVCALDSSRTVTASIELRWCSTTVGSPSRPFRAHLQSRREPNTTNLKLLVPLVQAQQLRGGPPRLSPSVRYAVRLDWPSR